MDASLRTLQKLALRSRPRTPRAIPGATVLVTSSVSARAQTLATTARNSGPNPNVPEELNVFHPIYEHYSPKKVWPPDFTRLSVREQLRYEKRFKRRVALRSARPRWTKFIKLAQLFTVTFVVIYAVLLMEWDRGPQPFAELRAWFWGMFGTLHSGSRASALKGGISADDRTAGQEKVAASAAIQQQPEAK